MNEAMKQAAAELEAAQAHLEAIRAKRGIPEGVDGVVGSMDDELVKAVEAVNAAAIKAASTSAG